MTTPSGWYRDPNGTPYERYWDGSAWTEQLRSSLPEAPPPPPAAAPAAPLTEGPAPKGRNNKALMIGGGAAVVVLAVVVGFLALTLGGGSNDTPDVVGMSPEDAQVVLDEAGFTYEYRKPAPSSDGELEQWTVTGQNPAAGDPAEEKSVTLWASTPLMDATSKCDGPDTSDGGATLVLDTAGSDAGSGTLPFSVIECVLEYLEAPSSVLTKIGETRALDGRQDDSWDGYDISWNYHPDDGLDAIIEMQG